MLYASSSSEPGRAITGTFARTIGAFVLCGSSLPGGTGSNTIAGSMLMIERLFVQRWMSPRI